MPAGRGSVRARRLARLGGRGDDRRPEAWGGVRRELVAGIGEDAFLVSSAFGPKVGFVRGAASYLISFNMARDLEAFAALARRIDEGL